MASPGQHQCWPPCNTCGTTPECPRTSKRVDDVIVVAGVSDVIVVAGVSDVNSSGVSDVIVAGLVTS